MFRLLIDTCVWLDLAKDFQQQAILSALEELIRQNKVSLILPRIVINEFVRNKERLIEESSRSLSATFKRVKEAVGKFGPPKANPLTRCDAATSKADSTVRFRFAGALST
jgi:hypothetical protein